MYVIRLTSKKEIYYLADFDFTISKNKKDALIFTNESNAHKIASIAEIKYDGFLANVINEDIQNIIY